MDNIFKGYDVYVKLNANNIIIAINSSAFIKDFTGWTLIESNVQGDKGHHAQGNYLSLGLIDSNGSYNYKYIDGELIERTDEEKKIENLPNILSSKISQIKKSCEKAIISGTDADVLGRGMLHYSLTETKQDDIKVLMQNIQNGVEGVLWHDDSRVMHEFYTAEQFTALYQLLFAYIITCKITSDGLEQYATDLANAKDIETLETIAWGTVLPDDIQTQVDEQIALMLGV